MSVGRVVPVAAIAPITWCGNTYVLYCFYYAGFPCHGFAGQGARERRNKQRPQAAVPVLVYTSSVLVPQQSRYVPAVNTGTIVATTGTTPYTSSTGCTYTSVLDYFRRIEAGNRHCRGTSTAVVV